MSSARFRAAATCLILAILAYYVWTAASNGPSLITNINPDKHFKEVNNDEINPLTPEHYGYYNLMADSFLAGKLELLLKPSPDLLRLPDPYDATANTPFRLHDVSLYKGRYYLYYGPVPAIVLFIPFRLLLLGKITEPFAAALFAFGAFLYSALILFHLRRRITPAVSDRLTLLAILSLGISNSIPFLLRRPIFYEVAISSAAFFVMLGFYLLVRSSENRRPSSRALLGLSLCWGLAVGCRPIFVIAGPVLAVIWVFLFFTGPERSLKRAIRDAVLLFLPFALCLFALGLYNRLRFDSWTEFGFHFQLAGIRSANMFRIRNVIAVLHLDTIWPPQVDFSFPFVHLRPAPLFFPGSNYTEPVVGFLASSPIIILLCAFWAKHVAVGARPLVAVIAGFGLSVLFFETFLLFGTSMRYQADFVFPLLVAALLLWLSVDSLVPTSWGKNVFRFFSIVLILTGITIHLAFGLTGYYDLFKRSHPKAYFALEDFFSPVSRLLVHFSGESSPTILDPIDYAGKDAFYLRMFSPRDATYRLKADFSLRSPADIPSGARLLVQIGRGIPFETKLVKNEHLEWILPLGRGVSRIQLFVSPLPPVAADVNPRYIVSISNVRVVDNITGETVD